jgi:tetratricopeptide (TPR) repeat protein
MEKSSRDSEVRWDLFICHASEDKDDFVRPLAERLVSSGLNVWYDDFSLKVGDSLRRSIDEGLSKSRFGVVILSPSFFKKEWPQKELDGLVAKEIDGVNVILPVWHNVDINEVKKYSLILSDKVAAKSSDGLENVISKLIDVVKTNIHDKSIKKENIPYFSEEETDILISALGSQGTIYLLETDQTGKFLQISDRDYLDDKKPEFRISYLEALDKLIERNLVRQETERWFVLNKIGFEYAHSLEINSIKDKAWEYFENKKDYVKSIETYREIVRKYPDSGITKEAQKMIGVNYLHLEDPINAEIELKKALDMGNDFSSAHFYYGEALLNNKKYKEAKIAYEASLSKADAPEWIKTSATDQIMFCQKGVTATLAALADEKYEIEKDKINNEIPLQEGNLKEKAGLRGLRYSSPLARELLELNLAAAKKKIETRLSLDKEIIFSGKKVKTDGDIHLLMERLRAVADAENRALKEKLDAIYKDCHANSFLDVDKPKIDQEIETLLKEKHTDLMIEKETL